MQKGSLVREKRKRGSDVWCYRWWEPGPNGKQVHRRIVVGTVQALGNKASAGQFVVGLRREINSRDIRTQTSCMTVGDLAEHFQQRELVKSNRRITFSTKKGYQGYLKKWIVPRWGGYLLSSIKAVEVEQWLNGLERARATCAKLRNVMSVLFNHARRYDLFDRNPIQFVRQSSKRRRAPEILTPQEVRRLMAALPAQERLMVLLAAGTGLRRSELFALQWKDVEFDTGQIRVTRSIVQQVVGICKTEASQKPVPLHRYLARALRQAKLRTRYHREEDWIFASPFSGGKKPYWADQVMRRHIHPVARRLGIEKRLGWHTFRHTYSTLLRATGAELKVMQELLRHSSIRVTLDHYMQAVTPAKRQAQSAVLQRLLRRERKTLGEASAK